MSEFVKRVYFDYFGFPLDISNKHGVPNIVCKTCVQSLRLWAYKKRPHFKYPTPMIWQEAWNHHDYCYFCIINIKGINKTNLPKWFYPNLLHITRPFLYSRVVSVPQAFSSTQNYHDLESNFSLMCHWWLWCSNSIWSLEINKWSTIQ